MSATDIVLHCKHKKLAVFYKKVAYKIETFELLVAVRYRFRNRDNIKYLLHAEWCWANRLLIGIFKNVQW